MQRVDRAGFRSGGTLRGEEDDQDGRGGCCESGEGLDPEEGRGVAWIRLMRDDRRDISAGRSAVEGVGRRRAGELQDWAGRRLGRPGVFGGEAARVAP